MFVHSHILVCIRLFVGLYVFLLSLSDGIVLIYCLLNLLQKSSPKSDEPIDAFYEILMRREILRVCLVSQSVID